MERLDTHKTRIRKRLAQEESGFTLIELLIVMQIIAILLLSVTPSYLSFRARAFQRTAAANVRTALPSVQAYYFDNNTYVGMTAAESCEHLQPRDQGHRYLGCCIDLLHQQHQGGWTQYKAGPSGVIGATVCT